MSDLNGIRDKVRSHEISYLCTLIRKTGPDTWRAQRGSGAQVTVYGQGTVGSQVLVRGDRIVSTVGKTLKPRTIWIP